MKPLIDGVRVGDVLYGTKNLRNYLRTCSVIESLKMLGDNRSFSRKKASALLYTPSKRDEFIVCVNNYDRFCVWSPNKDTALFFINGNYKVDRKPRLDSRDQLALMSPRIFSKWFIRTPKRKPDLRGWPIYAHYIWASLHMSAYCNQDIILPMPSIMPSNLNTAPWILSRGFGGTTDRLTIREGVLEALRRGSFRPSPGRPVNKGIGPYLGIRSYGPDLSRMEEMSRDLESLLSDPRLMERNRKERFLDIKPLQALVKYF